MKEYRSNINSGSDFDKHLYTSHENLQNYWAKTFVENRADRLHMRQLP